VVSFEVVSTEVRRPGIQKYQDSVSFGASAMFTEVTHSFLENAGRVPCNSAWPLPFSSFTVHHL